MRKLWAFALVFLADQAAAHEGHGQMGTHLHASDVFGLLALALVLAWWLNRRGR